MEATKCDAELYIDDVVNGRIIVGDYVRKCVQRHVDDTARIQDKDNPFYFDHATAVWVCRCFPILFKHTTGDLAGTPFYLMPWQAFIIYCVFGWKRKDNGFRRFRRVYIEVARRNGKSTLLAAIALFMLLLDGEKGAQVYSAATKRDQAKIVWNEARKMVSASRELKKAVEIYTNQLLVSTTDATFVPLSSDSKTLDGLNIHCGVIDELHAHANGDVFDVLDTATGSRSQPLIWIITTAGFNRQNIGYALREMVIEILNKNTPNDSWFGYIACIDDADNWADEAQWEKANPNLRYIPSLIEDLREKAKRATRSPAALNNFLVKCLCRWTTQGKQWLSVSDWDQCKRPFTYDELRGRTVFAGLDVAEKRDFTAACLCFPPLNKDEQHRYIWRFYLPEETISAHTANRDFRWIEWVRSGELIQTPGGILDEEFVREDINRWGKDFDLRFVGFDPHHARQLAGRIEADGFTMVELRQTHDYLSEASKLFEAQIATHALEHSCSSLMRWQIESVRAKADSAGNIKPVKASSNSGKIDGIVAAVMALTLAIRNPVEENVDLGFFIG